MATHSSILAWKNSMDRGASWAAVHGVGQDWAQTPTNTIWYGSHQPCVLARHLKCDFSKWKAEFLCLFGVNRFIFEYSCSYINALPTLWVQLLKFHSCLQRSSPLLWWPPSVFTDTHALVSLLQNLNKANYHLPIMVTDSGKPPMTNITDLRVQVCSCKNSKVDCNAAGAPHFSAATALLLSLFSLARKFTKLYCARSRKTQLPQTHCFSTYLLSQNMHPRGNIHF